MSPADARFFPIKPLKNAMAHASRLFLGCL
jgi:hypothetical protein